MRGVCVSRTHQGPMAGPFTHFGVCSSSQLSDLYAARWNLQSRQKNNLSRRFILNQTIKDWVI
jgi:hypothetical protein